MSLSKSVIWYSLGNIVSRSVGFLLLPFYSNLIAPSEFGIYALLMSSYAVISVFFQGGLLQGFAKFFLDSRDSSERKRIFSGAFNMLVVLGFVCAVVLSLLSRQTSLLILGSQDYSGLVITIAWILFFDSIAGYLVNLYKTMENARQAVAITIAGGIANLLFNLIFVVYFRLGISGILYSQLLSGIFQISVSLGAFKGNYIRTTDYPVLKKLMLFSLPIIASGFLSTLVDIADRFILDYFMDKSAVGIYSFAYKIAMVMNLFVIAFKAAWMPYSIRKFREGGYTALFGDTFSRMLSAGLFIFLSVSLLIEFVFSISFGGVSLFGRDYIQGITIIPLVMLGYMFNSMAAFFSLYPYVSGKSRHFFICDLVAFIVNLTLNLLLIPRYGLTGAAFATTLSFAAAFVYMASVSKDIKIEFHAVKNILIILASAIIYYIGKTTGNLYAAIFLLGLYSFLAIKLFKIKIGRNLLV